MEKLTISSSALKLEISREAINKLIRPYKKKPGWENSSFHITLQGKRRKVEIRDKIVFLLFKENEK